MLKFGAITIDTSHPKSFAKKLSEGDRAHYVAVFNDGFREEDEVNSFANHYGMKVCSSVAELADLVDLGLVHSCNWDKHLSYVAPFIERNKPVFIDKPLVGNLKDARKLMELVNVLANKIVRNLDAKGCNILINTNEVAGQSVLHTHVHIIPRYDETDTVSFAFKENRFDLEEVLGKING